MTSEEMLVNVAVSSWKLVIGRLDQGIEPLSDEQRLLLNYLPSTAQDRWDPEIPVLVPRNIDRERVCARKGRIPT